MKTKDYTNLSKSDRLKIYKLMMETLKRGMHDCLCGALYSALIEKNINYDPRPTQNIKFFPELMALKPENAGVFWWDVGDTQIRIIKMKDVIIKMETPSYEPIAGVDFKTGVDGLFDAVKKITDTHNAKILNK
jgi:hypothetical protein